MRGYGNKTQKERVSTKSIKYLIRIHLLPSYAYLSSCVKILCLQKKASTSSMIVDDMKVLIDKVHTFWEGHKIWQNFHQLFVLCTSTFTSQIIGGDFAKFCGLLRIYEIYQIASWSFSMQLKEKKIILVQGFYFGEWYSDKNWILLYETI